MTEEPVSPKTANKRSELHDTDEELKAINVIVGALKLLSDEEKQRALEYVIGRFGVQSPQPLEPLLNSKIDPALDNPQKTPIAIQDIRSLKESKLPKSANEMAALVAFYLSELAPEVDRRKQINKADIDKYFKSAGFKLPADGSFTLANAKNAGYLDTAGGGQYTLNPVGYNLVVHRMGHEEAGTRGAQRKAKPARKVAKKAVSRGKK